MHCAYSYIYFTPGYAFGGRNNLCPGSRIIYFITSIIKSKYEREITPVRYSPHSSMFIPPGYMLFSKNNSLELIKCGFPELAAESCARILFLFLCTHTHTRCDAPRFCDLYTPTIYRLSHSHFARYSLNNFIRILSFLSSILLSIGIYIFFLTLAFRLKYTV